MDLPVNKAIPTIMHIDLNSCFASIEQQANPLLRGRPLVVASYDTPGGCVLAASIEAKKFGIKTGDRVRDARERAPHVVVTMPDPDKYYHVHVRLMELFRIYSPRVQPRSIDEAVLDFTGTSRVSSLEDVAREIKQRIKSDIGEWLRVSIGIAPNRFLAKLGSGIHKPDGLDTIAHQNLEQVLAGRTLLDLPGINVRYEARLNSAGIMTPLDFLRACAQKLEKDVFGGISGHYWSLRLRGYEIDSVIFKRKSYGQEYALGKFTKDKYELSRLLYKLCEKMGRRLRHSGSSAWGIHVFCSYEDHSWSHLQKKVHTPLYSTRSLFIAALRILNSFGYEKRVTKLSVACYELEKHDCSQLSLFEDSAKETQVTDALDQINDRFGEFTITPALMHGMDRLIIKRVSFGGVKDLIE